MSMDLRHSTPGTHARERVAELLRHGARAALSSVVAPCRRVIPLERRIALVRRIAAKPWLPVRAVLVVELLDDLAEADPVRFHQLLWSEHLFYAAFYDESRFAEGLDGVRTRLLDELGDTLEAQGRSLMDVTSILEVGCSVGHVLAALEQRLPQARRLLGIDIDAAAIETGRRHLSATGSQVELRVGDLVGLEEALTGERFDVVLAAGVLLYLDETLATEAVATMLRHAQLAVAIADVADPEIDNAERPHSTRRAHDRAFVHNIDRMVDAAGGLVARRCWGGATVIDGQPLYLVVALPEPAGRVDGSS